MHLFHHTLKPGGLMVADIKDRFFPSVTHPFSNFSPSRSCCPSTECLLAGVRSGPGCQLEHPLTFSFWPPDPERHRLNLLSRSYILHTAVTTPEGSHGRYRCYTYSSKLLLSLYLQYILAWRAEEQSQDPPPHHHTHTLLFHLPWCSCVKEKILLFLSGTLFATERI